MAIFNVILILIIHAIAYVALQAGPTRSLKRTRNLKQTDRATSDAAFDSISERITNNEETSSADIKKCHPSFDSFGKRYFKRPLERCHESPHVWDEAEEYDQASPTAAEIWTIPSHISKVKSARILWYLKEFVPAHLDIDSGTVEGRKKLKAIALEEEKGRKSTPARIPSKREKKDIQHQAIKSENNPVVERTRNISIVEANPVQDCRVEDGPMQAGYSSHDEHPIQMSPPACLTPETAGYKGLLQQTNKVPERTLEIILHDDSPVGASLSASLEEPPTARHPSPVLDPPFTTTLQNVAEIPSSVLRNHPELVENTDIPQYPPEDIDIEPTSAVIIPIQEEETTAQDIILDDMVIGTTNTQEVVMTEVVPEDIVMGEAISVDTSNQEMITEDMATEETVTTEITKLQIFPEDVLMQESITEEALRQEMGPDDMITDEVLTCSSEDVEVEQGDRSIPPATEMEVEQNNENATKRETPLAVWYANQPQCRGLKRSIVPDHYGEEHERHGGNHSQRAVYPRDASFERFRAEVRLFPPIRLQLMLSSYVAGRLQEADGMLANVERHYLERVIRTPEQSDRENSFDAHWRKYAASRPHGQREPPFTLEEAVDLVTNCIAASLPHSGWVVRRAEQDFRDELQREVKHRHEELKRMSWSSSWVCPRRSPPHLAKDPMGKVQKFSRDYTRLFLYDTLDEENLRSYYLREGGETDTKHWIDGVKRRSDFISIRDPQTPWCIRREHNFQLLAKWDYAEMKDCRAFIHFTNLWFGEAIAVGSRSESFNLFRRFDKDRCEWLRQYAGTFPEQGPSDQ
ncbi:hypothetical protein SLS53_005965 [Cytospora paraplurivora]|uniref:Uncharacterized protein n=1 Tax=Cytospora paraplurivora TaxID=2898453 RepID=A0AAN9YAY8_9PEZI